MLQHAQVLGNRRPAYRELSGELANWQGTVEQTREDGASGGIAKGIELGFVVSTHLR